MISPGRVLLTAQLAVLLAAGAAVHAAPPAMPNDTPTAGPAATSPVAPTVSVANHRTEAVRPGSAQPAMWTTTGSRRTTHPALRAHVTRRRAAALRPTPQRHVVARAAVRISSSTTPQQSMDAAISAISNARRSSTRWVLSTAYGHWGTANWYHDVVYISPNVPPSRMYDVVVHEWSHLRSVVPYDGDVDAAVAAMNSWFGGSDLTGAERAADCMAVLQGASWTHYTPCQDPHWRDGARRLLAGTNV